MLISIVQKQTVAVSVVAAKSFYKGIDPFGLFRCDSYYNSNPSFGFLLRQEVDALHHVRDVMNHSVNESSNARGIPACIIPIATLAAELIVRVAGLLSLVLTTVLTGILGDDELIILSALHITIVPCVITEPSGDRFRGQHFAAVSTLHNEHIAAFGFTGAFDFVRLCSCIRRVLTGCRNCGILFTV